MASRTVYESTLSDELHNNITGTSAVAAPAAASTDGPLANLRRSGLLPKVTRLEILEDASAAYTLVGPIVLWVRVGGNWYEYATLHGGADIALLADRGWLTLLELPGGATHAQLQTDGQTGTGEALVTLHEVLEV